MNPDRKWDFLFMAAADPEYTTAKTIWDKEVKDFVAAYSSYRKSFTQITSDGTVLDNTHKNHNNYNNNTANRQQSTHQSGAPQTNRKRQQTHQDPNYSTQSRRQRQPYKALDICRDFNGGNEGHTDRTFCPTGRSHIYIICGQPHSQYNHITPKGKDKGSTKGKHKDEGKDKGKGEGHKRRKGKR
jgi:hypothetical protein